MIIIPVAKQDIKEAADWYNIRQPGLGKRFTSLIRNKVQFLKTDPLSIALRYADTRTAVLDVFPYMIHYKVDTSKEIIIILVVLHTSRDPDLWDRNQED